MEQGMRGSDGKLREYLELDLTRHTYLTLLPTPGHFTP